MKLWQRRWMLDVLRATAPRMTRAERSAYLLKTWEGTLALLAK